MPPTAPQPQYHIYISDWYSATQRIESIRSPQIAREYQAVMETLEDGWEILRPLALVGQSLDLEDDQLSPYAASVLWVLVMDLLDNFRGLVFMCVNSIPGADGFDTDPRICDAVSEAHEVQHPLRVLRLATTHSAFPPQLAPFIEPAAVAFDAWVERLESVTRPVAETEVRLLSEGAEWQEQRAA
jgi:hypothetical protein